MNGHEQNFRNFRKQACYLEQSEDHLPELTVDEALWFAAHLKIPWSVPFKVKEQRISEILKLLGILHCRNTRCCNLSGGERKRFGVFISRVFTKLLKSELFLLF